MMEEKIPEPEKEISVSGEKPKKDYLLPASILIAAFLVSISLVYNAGQRTGNLSADLGANLEENTITPTPSPVNVRPISSADHIMGNPSARVLVIEFSDLECPFCKRFHPVMKQALEYYGDKVAWVYRHLPLDELHSKARTEAEASECAAELGGNAAFWAYIDRLFEITPSNDGLDPKLLPQIAEDVGLNRGDFEKCLASGRHGERVESDVKDAANSGARGTPYSIVIAEDGSKYVIPGALPFESGDSQVPSVKLIIDEALR